jgi:hypothetical protein
MNYRNIVRGTAFLILLMISSGVLFAQNPNCTIIVPDAPLTAAGLATPYQLKATDPTDGNGPCSETNTNSSAFVQAAIFDPATGQISIYNPLVIDQGSAPAVDTVTPTLPDQAVVALWFGFNGNNLTQEGAHSGVLTASGCVNGLPNNIFGQYSYCNAPVFFRAANRAIRAGRLNVPNLGRANDGQPCPTVRDFYVVDQDQSDNLPVAYLISAGGLLAQNTQANATALTGATLLGNPSDNGLLDRFMDPAIGCAPWKVSDLADPGQKVPGLALNELQARAHQRSPMALIPAGDPMVLDADGSTDLAKVNAYRRGVDQPENPRPLASGNGSLLPQYVKNRPSPTSAGPGFSSGGSVSGGGCLKSVHVSGAALCRQLQHPRMCGLGEAAGPRHGYPGCGRGRNQCHHQSANLQPVQTISGALPAPG